MKFRFPFGLKRLTPTNRGGVSYAEMSPQQKSKALDRMYHEHGHTLYRVALKLGRSEIAADDLMQDTMLKATKYLHSFDGRSELAWLKQVMKTCFIDTYQHNKKRHAIRGGALEFDDRITRQVDTHDLNGELQELYKELLNHSGDGWQEAFTQLINDDLLSGLETLSKEHRDILIMSHLMDMPYEEIAEELQVPLGTVMSRLYRARNRLGESVASRSESLARQLAAQSGQRRGTKRGTRSKSTAQTKAKAKAYHMKSSKTKTSSSYDGAERSTLSDSGVTS